MPTDDDLDTDSMTAEGPTDATEELRAWQLIANLAPPTKARTMLPATGRTGPWRPPHYAPADAIGPLTQRLERKAAEAHRMLAHDADPAPGDDFTTPLLADLATMDSVAPASIRRDPNLDELLALAVPQPLLRDLRRDERRFSPTFQPAPAAYQEDEVPASPAAVMAVRYSSLPQLQSVFWLPEELAERRAFLRYGTWRDHGKDKR